MRTSDAVLVEFVLGAALSAALAAVPAVAQQRGSAGFVSATALRPPTPARTGAEARRRRHDFIPEQAIASTFLPEGREAAGTALLTSADEQTNFLLIRRTASSRPEVHARWDDLVVIRSGTGAVILGDSLLGSTYRAPGERVGGTITRSHEIVLHPGDIVRIPAAVPHAFVVGGPEPLVYLLIKQRRQELPIRWYGQPEPARTSP